MCVLIALECRASSNKEICVDKMVCSRGIDLQPPADMFHFLHSLCACLILWVCCAIARATWVDEWWCPLVNIAPLMCPRPKEPTSWTSYSPLTYFPHSSPLVLLPSYPFAARPISIFYTLYLPLLPSPSILLIVVFHSYSSAVEGGMRPYLFLLCALIFVKTERRDGWVGNAKL